MPARNHEVPRLRLGGRVRLTVMNYCFSFSKAQRREPLLGIHRVQNCGKPTMDGKRGQLIYLVIFCGFGVQVSGDL